jgi:hypothetical protein
MAKSLPVVTQEIWEKKIPAGKYSGPSIARLEITPARNGNELVSIGFENGKRVYRDEFNEKDEVVEARRIALKADGFKKVTKGIKVRPENAPRGPSEAGEALRQYDAELAEMFRRNRPTRP